jgi:RNA polymerase sigma-70 factor, ECF subfamily
VRAIAAGDPAGMERLYDRFASLVFGIALRVLRDRALAEEVVQETFVAAWKHAQRFDPARASARTWIAMIAHRRAVDSVRRQRFHDVVRIEIGDEVPGAPVAADALVEVLGRLDRDRVQVALASITHAQRQCIELAYYRGLTQQEIAVTIGAPLGTVKSRVRSGLMGLRAALARSDAETTSLVGFAVRRDPLRSSVGPGPVAVR